MRPANVFELELAAATSRPRAMGLRIGMTLLLALPFALASMPPRMRSAGLVMIVLFTGFFGAAVAGGRRRTDGRADLLRTLPIHPALATFDVILAASLVRLAATLAALALLLAVNAATMNLATALVLAAMLLVTVALTAAMGTAVARLTHRNAEVHLVGALAVGVLAFASGLFPTPPRLTVAIDAISPLNPIALLATRLTDALSGQAAPPRWEVGLACAIWVAVAAAIAGRSDGLARLIRRSSRKRK